MRPAPLEVCHILRPYLYWRQAVQRCVDREVETPADGFYFFLSLVHHLITSLMASV